MSPKIYTIGVYGTDERSFYRALSMRNVGIFVDIRARRGMRNPRYKYVNSNYLQAKLRDLNIPYAYIPQLAPTPEMRQMQQAADKVANIRKSDRTDLCAAYKKAFINRLQFAGYTLEKLLIQAKQSAGLPREQEIHSLSLFCVEREPNACHRSLVATEMEKFGARIFHIRA